MTVYNNKINQPTTQNSNINTSPSKVCNIKNKSIKQKIFLFASKVKLFPQSKHHLNQTMFDQQYQQSSINSCYNQSVPYTIVYEAERDMSLAQSMDLTIEPDQQIQTQNLQQEQQPSQLSTNNQQQTHYHSLYYNPRSHMQIRHSYLSKLISHGIITEKPKRKYRHLFVFDWDDTLLCTTYLNHFKFNDLKDKDYEMLEKIDQYVCKILGQCMKMGDCTIITNAAKGWVQYSSKKFLPKTNQFIHAKQLTVISARSEYGEQFPNEIKKWKVSAFQKLNSVENNHLITNIICIGDSTIEMEAGQILASSFEKSLLKTVKFRENPRIEELIKQQQLLDKKLDEIVNTAKNLTIRLQRKAGMTK